MVQSSRKVIIIKNLTMVIAGCCLVIAIFFILLGTLNKNVDFTIILLVVGIFMVGGIISSIISGHYSEDYTRRLLSHLETLSLNMKYCYSCGHPIPEDYPSKCPQCDVYLDLFKALKELDEIYGDLGLKGFEELD